MKELIAYIDAREREMLEGIVNIDSGSFDEAGADRAGVVLAERFGALGFAVERIPQKEHGDNLIGHKPGTGEKRILFVGHIGTEKGVRSALDS